MRLNFSGQYLPPRKNLLGLLGALWLVVGALISCAPVLVPQVEGGGEEWLVTLAPAQSVYSVTLHVLDSETNDPRCVALGSDIACVIGDILQGERTEVSVTGSASACSAFGYTSPVLTLSTYRPFPCRAEGGDSSGR